MHKKGFTLLELLMAAAIISALAVVATATYRAKILDGYAADAKNQARVVAMAVRLFELEYSVRLGDSEMPNVPVTRVTCAPSNSAEDSATVMMVSCGFLENRGWGVKEKFSLEIDKTHTPTRVCVSGAAELPIQYRGQFVCIDSVTGEEVNP